jgi:hypothetical protein
MILTQEDQFDEKSGSQKSRGTIPFRMNMQIGGWSLGSIECTRELPQICVCLPEFYQI